MRNYYPATLYNQVDCIDMRMFLIKVFETLHPGRPMINNWHLDLMIEYLKAVEKGKVKRLIVNLPPRSLKSICINVAWPAWLLGRNPNSKIITISYNQNLSEKHSVDCRLIMQSDWYKELFPNTVIACGMNTKSKFATTQHGFRLATSTGGTLTGEGADIIIIDDPISASDAFSFKKRKRTYEWFRSCLLSRLNDCNEGKIVLVMQRLHADDLTGALLRSSTRDSWKVLTIPAVSTKNHIISFGPFKYERKNGEQLYDNAFVIDSQGNKASLQGNQIPIKTQFSLEKSFISYALPVKSWYSMSYDLKTPNYPWFWEFARSNLFCHDIVLYQYEQYYCRPYNRSPLRTNYDLVFEKFFQDQPAQPQGNSFKFYGVSKDFNSLKRELGLATFNVQYQQEAHDRKDSVIKEKWLHHYNDYEAAQFTDLQDLHSQQLHYDTSSFDYVYQSWDCAVKCGVNNDYSVCSSWGVKNDKLYLLHILRNKIDYPKLREIILAMSSVFNPDAVLVEDCAAGQQIIQELEGASGVIMPIRPKSDKVTRLTLVSPLFEKAMVLLPAKAPWLDVLLEELLCFPHSEHDDQVDSVSQFLLWYQKQAALKKSRETLNFSLKCF